MSTAPSRRVLAAALALLLVAGLVADLARPAERQATVAALRVGLQVHRHTLARWLPVVGIECRFTPTCSHYADAVLESHGAARGSLLAARRLLRCGPWSRSLTVDPPPAAAGSGR